MSAVSKKILIFDKYPYISKMLAYGTNVPWLEHFLGTENYSLLPYFYIILRFGDAYIKNRIIYYIKKNRHL